MYIYIYIYMHGHVVYVYTYLKYLVASDRRRSSTRAAVIDIYTSSYIYYHRSWMVDKSNHNSFILNLQSYLQLFHFQV